MAESSTIGASFSQYQGDPNLGGGGLGFGRIDTRPIQDLARYVFLYNKSEYDQRQKDAEAAAKEISDYMNYDLNTSIPKDRKIIEDKYQKLLSYVRENPDAINYRNKEKWTEYQKMRHDLANDITNGKVRSALNINREKEISEEKNEERKKIMRDQLEKDIERTGIRDSLPVTQEYDLTIPELGVNKGMKFDVAKAGSNQIFKRDYVMFDRAEAMRAGAAVEFGIDAIDLGTETGIRKQAGVKQNFWVRGKDLFNQAIQSTKKEDGTLDESKISGLALSLLNQVKKYNADTEKERINIDRGIYRDKVGNIIDFGSGNFRPEHFQPINFQDGISAQELAVVAQYAAWPGDDYETKVIQTGEAIDIGRLGETIRHNKAAESIDRGRLALAQDQWKEAMTGGETVKNGAMERAKRIYADMQKLTDKNGVISPDKIRQLNAEQLKYLGVETLIQSESGGLPRSMYKPLTFEEDKEYAIQLINGEIRVLTPESGNSLERKASGAYGGKFDPTRSTNIFNMGTNILNEELQKAGAKELNSYMAIDLGVGGVTTNTTGGRTTQSGGRKEINRSEIKDLIKGRGYTEAEYEQLLKDRGIKIIDK